MSTHDEKPAGSGFDSLERSRPKLRVGNLLLNLLLVAVILLGAVWLPPVSLGKRLSDKGYSTIGTESWSVADPDGTQFTVQPEGLHGQLKAKLASVPRADFLEGKVDKEWVAAAESLPSYVDVKSPFYQLATRGEEPTAASLLIPIPNDAQPYDTLDVYAWDEDGWSWVPSIVLAQEDVIIADLTGAPSGFVAAQTRLLPPVVSADLAGDVVPAAAVGTVVELNPYSLALGDNGQVVPSSQPRADLAGSFAVVPVLTNRGPDGVIRSDLIDNLLVDASLRETHIDAILNAISAGGYQGIELGYLAINPALRGAFSEFAQQLAGRLQQEGKTLNVRVDPPRQVSFDEWDTGVYDWSALGRSVDALKVPCLSDPQAYVSDGQMDQLIRWAVSQVHRQKLQFVLSTRSIDLASGNPQFVDYADAMSPFTRVATESGRDEFKPGEQMVFTLSAGQGSTNIMYDEGCQTYWFRYRDEQGQEHTVWLQNAASIAYKLRRLAHYNLRGVAFQHLLDDDNDSQVWRVVQDFHTQTVPNMTDQFAVVWTITDESGKSVENLTTSLSDPRLSWGAPQNSGQYTVLAALSSDSGKSATVQGELQIGVVKALPTPTLTPSPTPAATKEPETTPSPTPEPTPTEVVQIAKAEAEATVTNTTLNLRAGPGTNYGRLGSVQRNDKLKILGKNPAGTWIKIVAPDGTEAWVILTYVSINVELADVAVAEVPPAPTPQPTSSAPRPVAPAPSGTGFGYGVQAHQDTARVTLAINDLGFGWLKQQVRWAETEGPKGKYGFAGLDGLVDTARGGGVKVMFSVLAAPSWARGGKSGIGPPDNYQDFADFMGAMATHFRGRVSAYEIWNEQNLKREWEGAPLSASDYVRLLRGAYIAIKAADPGAIVVSGAPTPTGISDGNWAIDDRQYLQQMYNAGLRSVCDAVGAHPSGYANPPDHYYTGGDFDPSRGFDDHPSFFFRNTMEDYYRIMAANGDGGKRVWATEFGWPTVSGMGVPPSPGYEFSADINEQQQADYIVRAYTWSRSWGHAGVMFLWNLNFWPTTGPENEMAKYGIVRGDWSPRPAYVALKNMPK